MLFARPSVCLSCGWIIQKTDEVRIMKFSPYSSPIPLVFAKFHPEILRVPPRGRQTRGWVKSAVFLSLSVNILKMVVDTAKVTIND